MIKIGDFVLFPRMIKSFGKVSRIEVCLGFIQKVNRKRYKITSFAISGVPGFYVFYSVSIPHADILGALTGNWLHAAETEYKAACDHQWRKTEKLYDGALPEAKKMWEDMKASGTALYDYRAEALGLPQVYP